MIPRRNGKARKPRRRKTKSPFRQAIDAACKIAGNQQKLAEACEVTQAAISKVRRTRKISADLAKAIERATRRKVRAARLRPDLWG